MLKPNTTTNPRNVFNTHGTFNVKLVAPISAHQCYQPDNTHTSINTDYSLSPKQRLSIINLFAQPIDGGMVVGDGDNNTTTNTDRYER